MNRYFLMMKSQGRENSQAQASSPNCFNPLQSRSDQESSPDVFTVMFRFFLCICFVGYEIYVVICDPSCSHEILISTRHIRETFFGFYQVGAFVVVNRVCKDCPISFPNKVTLVDLI